MGWKAFFLTDFLTEKSVSTYNFDRYFDRIVRSEKFLTEKSVNCSVKTYFDRHNPVKVSVKINFDRN